jgi:vitamin B12 transporter
MTAVADRAIALRRLLIALAWFAGALPTTPAAADGDTLEQVVITATARPESRTRLTQTLQVIDAAQLSRSTARSLTELLAEHSSAFFSTWTPAQTSINLRGAASDGQGKDFRSQVLVLLDGRRAGTANLSKLSPADIARIEIVRGPASVVHGSQSLGGVINLITHDGRSQQGTQLALTTGSWDLAQGQLRSGWQNERSDLYFGASAGSRNDYESGAGREMTNTSWRRWGFSLRGGHQWTEEQRSELSLRMDGVWDAGFRGSGGNVFSRDNRYNRSVDLRHEARTGRLQWSAHAYAVQDVDDFRWASPVIRNAANQPAPGTSVDNNYRQLRIDGVRLRPVLAPWTGNELLLGIDVERSTLRSTRFRQGVPGITLAQVPPQDNNQTEQLRSVYFEDAQSLWNDRVTLRAGVRYADGDTRFDPTPNLSAQRIRSASYGATTWSVGAALRVSDALTLRSSAGTGYRAPTATELAADFTALGGGRSFGNPDLEPETSRQVELGASWASMQAYLDVAVFENRIQDRIITRPRAGVANTSDFINNPADIVVRGLEWQSRYAVGANSSPDRWVATFGGAWNFEMTDRGAPATANSRRAQRMYEYQASVGLRYERAEQWSAQLDAVLRGPMWYDTEESLLVPAAEPNRQFVHRKPPFWVINARVDYRVNASWDIHAAINNVLDVNQHPIFIAIDKTPTLADLRFYNGGGGTSMPGREFVLGTRFRF